jgi:hypothetical protein
MLRICCRAAVATGQYLSARLQAIRHGYNAFGNLLW